jgi:DNA transformation protein
MEVPGWQNKTTEIFFTINDKMASLTDLPNIGNTLAEKLKRSGINTQEKLIEIGSRNALISISTFENKGVCLNMFYALEGAIQGIRWHKLDNNKKSELKEEFNILSINT